MKKLITIFLIFLSIFILAARQTRADYIAGGSATMAYNSNSQNNQEFYLKKKLAITKVLQKYNSPITSSVDDFLKNCIEYELDCYLLPSIAGLESFFGRYTHPNSNNGFGWGGGYIMFGSWSEGIRTVARGLRENYIDKGAITTDQIGPIYAQSPTWSPKVKFFQNQFEAQEKENELYFATNKVQL